MPRKTPDQALADVDKVALLKVKIAKIEAEKDEAVNKVLATYSEPISDLKTDLKRLSSRLRSWLITNSKLLWPLSPTYTGNTWTTQAELRWQKTPNSIVPLDKDRPDSYRVDLALKKGYEDAVRTVQTPNKDHLETLTDDELKELGWKRHCSTSLKVKPITKK